MLRKSIFATFSTYFENMSEKNKKLVCTTYTLYLFFQKLFLFSMRWDEGTFSCINFTWYTANMYVYWKYHKIDVFLKYIPREVVFSQIFLQWFKCTNYSLYDMNFFPKIQLEIPYIGCTWDSNWMPKGHYKQYICSESRP